MPDLDMGPLKGRRLFVGTPLYDGKCHADYAFAIAQLTGLCTRFGIELHFLFVTNDALITKARNIAADRFVRGGGDHLIFIDGDIGFDPRDVLHLMALQVREPDYDVIAAPYPTKQLAWGTILKAAKTGMADADPDALARISSAVLAYPLDGPRFPLNEPVEVTQAGTGFMMIRAETFARYRAFHPARKFGPLDDEATPPIHAYFETEIDTKQANLAREIKAFAARNPDATAADILAFLDSDEAMGSYGGRHISEDYAFCRRVREAGMAVWLCPWMELSHTGSHRFTSRLADLGQIGAA
ncbi:hypothetical protein HL653_15290 [Sphingomonas sp. AP4-R1]|uniref:hypothetical protein n=1 Tax=Sphingomonas sp. AP4-R1 TaxID=2735134 RepID=UPI0014937917|nr:hypothetical protein [Sphingomonas sp. AP4-R1]QJU58950.1 hypothetical protein HL653_15290 [Sphingomonas sp. AP4-R1]